jgi:hypothetical protein
LNNNFSTDLCRKTVENCEKKDKDSAEHLRLAEDALSCVENIEFIGGRSQPYTDKRKNAPPSNSEPFCSMPVKITFSDRSSRINFEKTLSDESGIRASQSYPKQIRDEMTLFRKALQDRYKDMLILTRPAPALELIAFKKNDGDKKWTKLSETHPLPMNIMLSTYKPPTHIVLPALDEDAFLDCQEGVDDQTENMNTD